MPEKSEKERDGKPKRSRKKSSVATILVIIGVVAIAAAIIISKISSAGSGVSSELAQCISSHSTVYIQLGCHFCAQQEQLFGDNWKYLNVVDCYYTPEKCNVIIDDQGYIHTPTWIINNQSYPGVQSIETLKQLTGC